MMVQAGQFGSTDPTLTLRQGGLSEDADYEDLISFILDDKYELIEPLGEGAYGCVFRACHLSSGRPVAIKVLNPRLSRNPDFIERFCQEALTGARLQHPNTVAIHDFGRSEEGIFYITMELLRGRSLTRLIKDSFPLPLERVFSITRQVLRGLQGIHAAGIIHADVKSDNIVVEEGERDVVKIVDFGIARLAGSPTFSASLARSMGSQKIHMSGLCGTPGYVAPEVISGSTPGCACDIYAAGVVLYQMLTGRMPFRGDTPRQILQRQLDETIVPPSQIDPDLGIPPALEAVLVCATAHEPSQRYSTIEEFRRALDLANPKIPRPIARLAH